MGLPEHSLRFLILPFFYWIAATASISSSGSAGATHRSEGRRARLVTKRRNEALSLLQNKLIFRSKVCKFMNLEKT